MQLGFCAAAAFHGEDGAGGTCTTNVLGTRLFALFAASVAALGIFFAIRIRSFDDQWGIKSEFRAALLASTCALAMTYIIPDHYEVADLVAVLRNLILLSLLLATPLWLCKRHSEARAARQSQLPSTLQEQLEDFLFDPERRSAFLRFLVESFCPEPLLFWVDVEKFKKIALAMGASSARSARLQTAASAIVAKYLVDGAPVELNIRHDLRQEAVTQFRLGSAVSTRIFDRAQQEAVLLLRADAFLRFLKSAAYRRLVKGARGSMSQLAGVAP